MQTSAQSASTTALPYARTGGRWACIMLGLMASLPFQQPWHDLPWTSFHAEWLAAFCGLLGMLFLLPRPAASPIWIPVGGSAGAITPCGIRLSADGAN